MADHPLKSANRHSLGKPLPYQLADSPQTPPQAIYLAIYLYPVRDTSGINPSFDGLSHDLGAGINVLLTRSPLSFQIASYLKIPLDLHVLGAPLAFTLS